MTKALSNRTFNLFYESSVIIVRKWTLFTKFCVAWRILPPTPNTVRVKGKKKGRNIVDNRGKGSK